MSKSLGNGMMPEDITDQYGADILRLYRRLGGEVITLGSDAHRPADVGCFIRQRQELLRECGFRYFTTFTGGKPEFKEL